jgi:hypothetical protein
MKFITLTSAYKIYKRCTYNVMPKGGEANFLKELARQKVNTAKLRKDLFLEADRIMESGQEARTGSNFPEKLALIITA